jgi:hypothetical protein
MPDSLPQRIVPFYGDEIIAVQNADSTIFVLFNRLCDNLGLNRPGQLQRIQRHAVLKEGLTLLTIQTDGGPQTLQCLRIDLLPLWLSGVQAARVKPELQDKLIRYQAEAAQVLWQAFRSQILIHESEADDDESIAQLQRIADMGRAITSLAEQQIELQRQQQHLVNRMDKAARVIKDMQAHYTDVEVRLGVLEDKLHPTAYITEAQATEVSNTVKALAEFLASRGGESYQAIYRELYSRFGVSSYKLIRQEQYKSVLIFLEDWRKAAKPPRQDDQTN